MAKDRLSGKLTVILHADIAGSTALVHQDEQLAHERIQDAFRRFIETIEKYQGNILELRGDALLAHFERASDAVTAALSFQADHTYHISRLKDNLRPTIRVGIAMGEVVIADNTVTGSGVVLAQRVEQLADPGGVCITAALHEAIPKRMPFDLENIGEQVLKGYDDPVRVYRVELSANQSIPIPQQNSKSDASPSKPKLLVVAIVMVLVVAGGAAYWFKTQEPKAEAASIERMAFPLPDKPSIAVLPFTNMSNDAEQDFFAYGMTDDLITDISKISGLFIVSRNSVAKYKGKTVEIRKVAEELGVRYIMEGSVRRVGNDVRINAQLIDALSGGHKWAERYDGSLNDVFAMQDQIIASIVDELEILLIGSEQTEIAEIQTTNSDAYDAYLHGWERYRQGTPEDFAKAKAFFEQAIELDPDYAQAYSSLAAVDWGIAFNGWARPIGIYQHVARARSRQSLKKAMEHPSALTYQISAERSAIAYRKPERALSEAKQAIELDANDPAGHLAMTAALLKAGNPVEATKSVRTAMRLDPHYPAFYLNRLAQAQYLMGEFQDAAETLEKSSKRNPYDDWTYVYLAATYGQLGKTEMAKQAVARVNQLRAKAGWGALTVELAQDRERLGSEIRYIFKWFGDLKPLRAGLRKAGVPEGNEWYRLATFKEGGADIKGAVPIDDNTAKMLFDRDALFVDIWWQWPRKRIPNSYYLDIWSYEYNEVTLSEIAEKDQELVIYHSRGDGGLWMPNAVANAVIWGFEKVYYYEGGLHAWEKTGYPVDKESFDLIM